MFSILCRLLPVQAVKFWNTIQDFRALNTSTKFAYPESRLRPFLGHGRAVEIAMRVEQAVITQEVYELNDRPRTHQACKPMFHSAQ